MAIYFSIIYLIMNFGLVFCLPIKNNLVINELTDEQIRVATKAIRNDIRYSGPISKEISKNAIYLDSWRWPSGVMYYTVDHSLNKYKNLINNTLTEMMKEIGNRNDGSACVSFIPRTNVNQRNYVTYFNESDEGCWSFVGRRPDLLQQPISIGEGCQYPGTIMHETMHALGFYHEHQRSDRNAYVVIHLENVWREDYTQFEINLDDRLLAPFDYESIMIYGNKAFSYNTRDTIVARNGQQLVDPFYKESLTNRNIDAIRSLYGCGATDVKTSTAATTVALLKPTEPSSSTSLKITLVNTTVTVILVHAFYFYLYAYYVFTK